MAKTIKELNEEVERLDARIDRNKVAAFLCVVVAVVIVAGVYFLGGDDKPTKGDLRYAEGQIQRWNGLYWVCADYEIQDISGCTQLRREIDCEEHRYSFSGYSYGDWGPATIHLKCTHCGHKRNVAASDLPDAALKKIMTCDTVTADELEEDDDLLRVEEIFEINADTPRWTIDDDGNFVLVERESQ
ncbi:MAG TPA: hypothetical protein HPP87_10080 [Planctomycetes bacterium]|nr:hypothetical protein [Planctomycetota bacterium]